MWSAMELIDPLTSQTPLLQTGLGHSHYDDVRRRVVSALSTHSELGERTPSERQLAQQLGVSNATIGRVMHELHRVGIVQRVPGKGTYLKSDAQQIASFLEQISPSQNGIGIGTAKTDKSAAAARETSASGKDTFTWIVTSFKTENQNNPARFWPLRASSAIERAIQKAGGRTLLANTQNQSSAQMTSPDQVAERGVNSVIIISPRVMEDWPHLGHSLMAQTNSEKRWPVVQLPFGNHKWPFDAVNYDDERGIYSAVSHLWDLGHREIAFICPDDPNTTGFAWTQRREDAFRFAMTALSNGRLTGHVLSVPFSSLDKGEQWWSGAPLAVHALKNEKQYANVSAALIINDSMAQVFLEEAHSQGIRVPDDLSVVGFDDDPWSGTLGLTTVHVPVEEMAEQAVQLVNRNLAAPTASRVEIVLPPPLIVRESTGLCSRDASDI